MEGRTATIELSACSNAQSCRGNCHTVHLYRSEKDVQQLLDLRMRIRLCKSLRRSMKWRSPGKRSRRQLRPAHADASFQRFYHAIATHDPRMIGKPFASQPRSKSPRSIRVSEMLYGVRTDLQRQLVRMATGSVFISLRARLVLIHAPPGRASRNLVFFCATSCGPSRQKICPLFHRACVVSLWLSGVMLCFFKRSRFLSLYLVLSSTAVAILSLVLSTFLLWLAQSS